MKRLEEIEQARVVRWTHLSTVRELFPELRWLHHSPNGGKRDKVAAGQMVALGTKKGFPDLILPVGDFALDCPGLVIEMKSDKGTTSSDQDDWLEHFRSQGWRIEVARSAVDAKNILIEYLLPMHPQVDTRLIPPLP